MVWDEASAMDHMEVPLTSPQDQNLFSISQGITLLHQLSPTSSQYPNIQAPPPTYQGLKDALLWGETSPACAKYQYNMTNTNITRQIKPLRNQPAHGRGAMTKVTPPQPGHVALHCRSTNDHHQGQEGLGPYFPYFKQYLPVFFFQFLF